MPTVFFPLTSRTHTHMYYTHASKPIFAAINYQRKDQSRVMHSTLK